MASQRLPDGRLVYLHCSSIFKGANAQLRKLKTIDKLLQKHRASIRILTNEFATSAIAVVAKQLLEEQIFDSLPRAKLRYPELFQTSVMQEAERAASEAEVARIEDEAAQNAVLISDDEGGDEGMDHEGDPYVKPRDVAPEAAEASIDDHNLNDEASMHSPALALKAHPVPILHPVYLPFKTQHKILVPVQSLLEECCFDFGNAWVPDLMKAREWYDAESIELTQWTQRVSKRTKSLPPSAIKSIAGKSNAAVLLGTSKLRHSAVHRLRTSASGILQLLNGAIIFAEALNDLKRAEKIADIKQQLEASVEEIVQHQNLLERKLTDQLEDIARRKAELAELEKSSIEEMLTTDEQQRTKVGLALERMISGVFACDDPLESDAAHPTSGADDKSDNSETRANADQSNTVTNAQTYDHRSFSSEVLHEAQELNRDDEIPSDKEKVVAIGEGARGSEVKPLNLYWSKIEESQNEAATDDLPNIRDQDDGCAASLHDAPQDFSVEFPPPDEDEEAFALDESCDLIQEAYPAPTDDWTIGEPVSEESPTETETITQESTIKTLDDVAVTSIPEISATPVDRPTNPTSAHIIALKFLIPFYDDNNNNSSDNTVLRSVIQTTECTRTAILRQAKKPLQSFRASSSSNSGDYDNTFPHLQDATPPSAVHAQERDEMFLVSLDDLSGRVFDLLACEDVEDLSLLVQTVERSGLLPEMTVRVSPRK